MRLRSFVILILVCASASASFITAITWNKKIGKIEIALNTTVLAQPGDGRQCPPCVGACRVNGFSFADPPPPYPHDCGNGSCNGTAQAIDIPEPLGQGSDEYDETMVQCTGMNGDQKIDCGTIGISYRIIKNVCCPVGQTQPSYECSSTGSCDIVDLCGSNDCQPGVSFCSCPSGSYNPHQECVGNSCKLIENCGVNLCITDGDCGGGDCGVPQGCNTGSTWSFTKCCCVDESEQCVSCPVVIDILGNGFDLTSAIEGPIST